jgi:hypothetical protein
MSSCEEDEVPQPPAKKSEVYMKAELAALQKKLKLVQSVCDILL